LECNLDESEAIKAMCCDKRHQVAEISYILDLAMCCSHCRAPSYLYLPHHNVPSPFIKVHIAMSYIGSYHNVDTWTGGAGRMNEHEVSVGGTNKSKGVQTSTRDGTNECKGSVGGMNKHKMSVRVYERASGYK